MSWNKGKTKKSYSQMSHAGVKKSNIPWDKDLKGYNAGEKNNRWKGGITPINSQIRNSIEYSKWRDFTFERDDYTCQICGQKGGELRANHIKKFSDYPELRTEPINGITICTPCDYKFIYHHEEEWESYFNFNLTTRGFIKERTVA